LSQESLRETKTININFEIECLDHIKLWGSITQVLAIPGLFHSLWKRGKQQWS